MKKIQSKNVKSQILVITLVLVSAFLLIINFIPIFNINAGLTTEFTGAFSSDYRVFVNRSDPDMNYDDFSYSSCIGNSCETYFHFNFALLPMETERLYFSLSGYSFYDPDWVWPPPVEDVEINIISIEESWNVSEITWNNKPEHGEIIVTANVSHIVQDDYPFLERYDLQKAVDITEFYRNHLFEEISLCINITTNNEGLNNTNVFFGSFLLWNYHKVILSYTNIISTSIIFSMLIGTIYFLRKDIYVCPNCGARKVHADIACYKCETLFERDLIIKKSDYHLIIIVLLIFAFFEGTFLIITSLVQFLYPYYIILPFILIFWMILFYQLLKRKIKHYKAVNL